LTDLPGGSRVRVWLPVPKDNEHQSVHALKAVLPAIATKATEPKYGNEMLYFETTAPESGQLAFSTPYLILRTEASSLAGGAGNKVQLTDEQRALFLSANRRVPLEGKPISLLTGLELPDDPLQLGRVLYNRVDDHVKYDKSQPGYGNGDVNWVCDSRFGNCTDFHSLFISFSRSRGVPARFEIGFPLPPQRGHGQIGGYHCWAFFHADDQGWVPVDISEADKHSEMKDYYFGNLTENRVAFTTGRDINLVPQQSGEPLNYFVFPYVEVDGKLLAKEQFKLDFSYSDQASL
jgi:transglutaminase-like putative cysteine protease